MQKIFVLLISILIFISCNVEQKGVEYKRIGDFDLGNLSKDNAKLTGFAVFINLTDKDLEVKDLILDLSVDGKDIGTIVAKYNKKVAAKAEFSIPFQYNYETSALKTQNHDLNSKYEVILNGNLTLLDTDKKEIHATLKYATSFEYHTKQEIRQQNRIDRKEQRKERREERRNKRNNN